MFGGAIKYGVQLTVAVLTVCVLGIMFGTRLPIQMIPDLEIRTITVKTAWPGATPQDVEQEILILQEDYLRTLSGLQRMIATASTGEAVIELEFAFGTDINEVLIRVNNALTQVPAYPENVDEPRLYATSFSQNAFMFFRVEPLAGYPVKLDMVRMRDFLEDYVQPRMERVPGVSQVAVVGGAERQIQIRVDPNRLAATGVTLADLRRVVRARNRDVSAGDIDSGKRRYLLRTVGRFEQVEELETLIVARRGDALIRLGDVASVSLEHFELRQETFVDGRPTINLFVRKEVGSNVIAIKDAMMPLVEDLNRQVLAPARLQITPITDDVRYVKASIANVWRNLMIGSGLATLIMFLFLRSGPATVVGVIGIPVCTIAAFIGLLAAGRTINVISLAGIAFAIGMTLDNSIVVLESIERHRRRGLDRFAAALAGVRRVWPAVLASTLTTVLVFAPVIFIEQEAGQLFSDIAIAISASIIASMFIAITVVPSASARIALDGGKAGRGVAGWIGRMFRRIVVGLVGWLIRGPIRSILCAGGIIAGAGAIIVLLTPPAEYLPEGEEAKTFSMMIAPAGYNLAEMSAIAEKLHEDFVPYVGLDPALYSAGESDIPAMDWIVMFVNPKRIFMIAETTDPTDINALMGILNKRFRQFPGMRGFSSRGSIISSNDGGSRSVNLDIAGTDLEDIYKTATAAYRRTGEVFDDPEIGSDPPSLVLAQPLIELRPNWARAAELGFTADELGFSVAALADGAYVDEFLLAGDRVDIFLFGTSGANQDLRNLPLLPLFTPEQGIVPVSSVADIVERVDTDTIRRLDGQRTVTLNIIPPRSVALETAVGVVEDEVVGHLRRAGRIPAGVTLDISGASDQLETTRAALLGNFIVALILCYLLLAAIFSHWGIPLIIMTTVPLGVAGGIVGLWLLNASTGLFAAAGIHAVHQPFDMITMLGFVILLGTVVNNPILIVDQTLHNLRENLMAPEEAVRDALETRLRPMMMSTITTVFGIAPLVLIPGAGTELYRGVGAIVLFGLLFATFVTIFFLPPLLSLVFRIVPVRPARAAEADSGLSPGQTVTR
ncbi:MAG: efflux RND transporter permease subunit [Alphaproteobacteria bacterium]|jgi:multidrug efflux pump subunit AcrB|nr:efflux RND transporter permease subunit [Alphaproteobacteria bacterium]MDP6515460.1 efflux RND transporter permease subunit [Alphaproteobacteria bacterium]